MSSELPILSKPWSVTAKTLSDYAWVSGDINPIHFDVAAAKDLGLPHVIVHGLFAHAKLMSEVLRLVEQKNLVVKHSSTKFSSMMPCPGDYKIEIWPEATASDFIAKVVNASNVTCVELSVSCAAL